jgi:hypothetical protein
MSETYCRARTNHDDQPENDMLNRKLILAVSLLALGCATQPGYVLVGRTSLTNADGHVIGHRQTMRDARGGEEMTQTVLYAPRINGQGETVGYEERVVGGAVLRNLDGRAVGERWVDMRSRGSNPANDGLAIVYPQ